MRVSPDVTQLRDFYQKPLGQLACRLLTSRIRNWWPDLKGRNLYGLGFAAPFLSGFRDETTHMAALMPARQGVLVWPVGGPYRSLLVEDIQLPLEDESADRILLVHCLEMSEAAHNLLREIWRVLKPEGRLLVITPNRRGIWARFDTTPFGHGRPYSRGQLRRLFIDAMFAPENFEHALFIPPANERVFLKSAPAWERVGNLLWPAFSGVLLAEARKEVFAPLRDKTPIREPRLLRPVPAAPCLMLDDHQSLKKPVQLIADLGETTRKPIARQKSSA